MLGIGRTGRAGKKGIAISLVEAHDIDMVGKVERYTEQPLKRRVVEGLRPKNKEARPSTKAKKPKTVAKKKALKKAAKAGKENVKSSKPKRPAKAPATGSGE